MKAETIIRQLYNSIPFITDYFNDTISVSTVTRNGSTVTVNTPMAHGLVTGQVVAITGANKVTRIVSLTHVNGIATAITDQDHDLTEGWFTDVVIGGANESGYNGTFQLLSVPNRLTFTFKLTSNPPSPATTNDDILLLNSGIGDYNGRFAITVINPTRFSYEITSTPYSPAQGTIKVKKNIRISGAATIDRAVEAYTKQPTNKLWAFVVLEDTQVNKDRFVKNDSIATRTATDDYRLRLLKNFSVYVFAPSVEGIAARTERDLMEDIEVILYKSLLAVKIPSPFTEPTWSMVTPAGNGVFEYNKAFYIHRYQFQTSFDVLIEDTAFNPITRAFRDITLNYLDFMAPLDGEIVASADVNLDDKPI